MQALTVCTGAAESSRRPARLSPDTIWRFSDAEYQEPPSGEDFRIPTMTVTFYSFALTLGLSFFLGLAFEDFYGEEPAKRPGGIRTFPLLALAGEGLTLLDPAHLLVFVAGILVLGGWLLVYYLHQLREAGTRLDDGGVLMVPLCNLVAFMLGPLVLLQPAWLATGLTVITVLLLGWRERLHVLAHKVPAYEIITAGKFLVLTGIVLPLLPRTQVTTLTPLTPYAVWLAVIAVSALSYASYLVRRYVSAERGVLLAAVLGGLYSSTATTVVLARRMREAPDEVRDLQIAIVVATSLMYLRLAVVIALFNLRLALTLAPALLALTLVGLLACGLWRWMKRKPSSRNATVGVPSNPLEITTALMFAVMFVLITLATEWVKTHFGHAGVYGLAGLVGVTDIDPFVLSLAQGGVRDLPVADMAIAVLVAASSNNVLKGCYALGFAGLRRSLLPAIALVGLAAIGVSVAILGFA